MNRIENVTINIDANLSINELVEKIREGFDVQRSAHVGNLSAYNLTLADAGIPMLLVDQNQTGKDSNYYPELVMTREGMDQVAPFGRIVCRTAVESGQFLDDMHIESIERALPDSTVYTNTSFLRENLDISEAVVGLGFQYGPEMFGRVSTAEGVMQPVSYESVTGLEIMQLADDPREAKVMRVMPNVLDIVICFAVQARNSGRDVIYHVSGPDMVKYIKKETAQINFFYDLLAQLPTMSDLPKKLRVEIAPGASAVLATTTAKKAELEAIEESLGRLFACEEKSAAERRAFFTGPNSKDDEARNALIEGFRTATENLRASLFDVVRELPEIAKGPRNPGFITQYDVTEEGLVVSGLNTSLSFAKLQNIKSLIDIAMDDSS